MPCFGGSNLFIYIILTILGLLALVVLARAIWIAPFAMTITHTDIEILEPGSAFDGFRILHLSDFHLRKGTNPGMLRMLDEALAKINGEKIDLICLNGDILETDCGRALLEQVMRRLRSIGASEGIIAVLGNHDYNHYTFRNLFLERFVVETKNDIDALIRILSDNEAQVLRNRTLNLGRDGERLTFAGIDDFISGRHSIQTVLEDVRPDDCVVFLTHSPDVIAQLADRHVDLVLAGHTHGGQIRLPLLGSLVSRSRMFRGHVSGLFDSGSMKVFITRGVGIVKYAPMRFRCPPEFSIVELCSKSTCHNRVSLQQ
ncbi:metallophosphoesterase [bacterium]|nr:metallophosphoesterase [bacterium]